MWAAPSLRSHDIDGRLSLPDPPEPPPSTGPGVLRRDVFDPRWRPPISTAPRLVWCSQPDATGKSELALRWPVLPGHASYRVYLGDERRLADTLAIPPDQIAPTRPRVRRANTIWQRAAELDDKDAFTLLTEQPITATGSEAAFRTQLPGTLRGVQFVRIVPITAGGTETPFGACGLVPVAIPSPDRPPAPRLRATAQPDGTVALRIEASGLRVPADATEAPQYRLRRTRGTTTDALLMPVVAPQGELEQAADGWSADVVDGEPEGLPPFVRHTWVAEVRLPAEPDLAADAIEVPTAAGPLWEASRGPAPAAWSSPSLPASTTIVPPEPPGPAVAVTYERHSNGTATVRIPRPPLAHPRAPAPYAVVVFRKDFGGPTVSLPPIPITAAPFTFRDATTGDDYIVALVDPLGRMGTPVSAQGLPLTWRQ